MRLLPLACFVVIGLSFFVNPMPPFGVDRNAAHRGIFDVQEHTTQICIDTWFSGLNRIKLDLISIALVDEGYWRRIAGLICLERAQ